MLLVSARRQGLSLTVCEKPTLYLSFFASLGRPLLGCVPPASGVEVALSVPHALRINRASTARLNSVNKRVPFTGRPPLDGATFPAWIGYSLTHCMGNVAVLRALPSFLPWGPTMLPRRRMLPPPALRNSVSEFRPTITFVKTLAVSPALDSPRINPLQSGTLFQIDPYAPRYPGGLHGVWPMAPQPGVARAFLPAPVPRCHASEHGAPCPGECPGSQPHRPADLHRAGLHS